MFNLMLKLAPQTSEIILYSDSSKGHEISRDSKNYANPDGSFNYEVKPISISLGKTSILDAINKCPDHSGLHRIFP